MSTCGCQDATPATAPTGRQPARGAAAGDTSLERLGNTVRRSSNNARGQVIRRYTQVCAERCKDWFCPHCCKVQGPRFRARVIDAWEELQHPMMLTFTVDPELFSEGPEAAYRHVTKRRAIARVLHSLRSFHSGKWFVVVEFTERGWPHWHVVVDSAFVPVSRLEAEWAKHAPKGRTLRVGTLGMVRYSKPKQFDNPRHALLYATKYLTKVPEHGFPDWAMDYKGRLRRFSTSRGFWGNPPTPESTREGKPRPERTHRERVKRCGTTCRVLAVVELADSGTGELRREKQCVGRLAVPLGNLRRAIEDLRSRTLGEVCGAFFEVKSSLCYPGRWQEMEAELAEAWADAGHPAWRRPGGGVVMRCRWDPDGDPGTSQEAHPGSE